jgi:hypothetical protein
MADPPMTDAQARVQTTYVWVLGLVIVATAAAATVLGLRSHDTVAALAATICAAAVGALAAMAWRR